MPHYKLYYFNSRARGEVIRLMFITAGVDYEDIRFEQEEWKNTYKPRAPFGQSPYLEIDGGDVVLCQSHAIARYLARLFGLAGDSLLDQAKADMIADSIEDYIVKPCVYIRREKDEQKKEEKRLKYEEEELPRALGFLENQLSNTEAGNGYLVGGSLSWADIILAHWLDWTPGGVSVTAQLDKFPRVRTLCEKVRRHPRIAKWLQERPVTELYKLTYFNGRGQAEFLRWMFEVATQDYEDDRFDAAEWRSNRKPETPFGQVPTLEVDGSVVLCQRQAIGRFLAHRLGLGGTDEEENAWVDMVALCVDDTRKPIEDIRFEDPDKKEKRIQHYEESLLPIFLQNLEKMCRPGGDFFMGDKLTWCDLVFVNLLEWFDTVGVQPALQSYPRLRGVKEGVLTHPKIRAWIHRRPHTPF